MSIKEWSTNYPTAQDADPIQTNQPDLTDESAPGAGDGDETRSSQVESIRDKLHAVCKIVGDNSNLPAGSILDKLLKLVDTKDPILYWNTNQSIDVSKFPGSSSTVKITLQDGTQRYFTGTLAWSFANGVGDLGLDTGSEAVSTWYFMYLVPKSGDNTQLSVRASINNPDTGPSGYTNFKYLGPFYNKSDSNIARFIQTRNRFDYAVPVTIYNPSPAPLDGSFVAVDVSASVPVTASLANMFIKIDSNTAGQMVQMFVSPLADVYAAHVQAWNGGTGTGDTDNASVEIPLFTSQTIYRKVVLAAGTGQPSYVEIKTLGYIDNYVG